MFTGYNGIIGVLVLAGDIWALLNIFQSATSNEKKLLWLLQELFSSTLFDLIACDLGSFRLKEHQIRKLQTRARQAHTSLTFLTEKKPFRGSMAAIFSLIVSFESRRLLIERALHRPTPHAFPRSVTYARFTLHTEDRLGFGPHLAAVPERSHLQPRSVPETARSAVGGF